MRKISCYVITKPVQYINATNIDDDNEKDCYITNTFSDAELFAKEMENRSTHWKNIFFVNSKLRALYNILRHKSKYSSIYLDSDMGIILRLFLVLLYPKKIYVYEEGLASYIPELRLHEINTKYSYKFLIDAFLGENWSGGAFRTKGIYLYHPNAFKSLVKVKKKTQILSFKQPLIKHINSLYDIKIYYSQDEIENMRGKNILLYLTSWIINPEFEEIYKMYPDFIKVIKLHPHIRRETISNDFLHFDYYPKNIIPAEILISKFIEIADKLVIIHEGTAAMLNIVTDKKIIEYNIANSKYKEVFIKIKDEFEN